MRTGLLGILVAAGLVLVGATGAEGRATCGSAAKAPGNTVVARNGVALVWHNKRTGDFYGCTRAGKVRRYGALCCEDVRVTLGGRFMGYSYVGTAIGDESTKLGLFDLANGKQLRIAHLDPTSEGAANEIDTNTLVTRFRVSTHGILVWIQRTASGSELRAGDGKPRTERIVDHGAIDPKALTLSRDGRSVRYVKDGAAQAASLR